MHTVSCEVGGIEGYEEIAMKTLTQKIGDIGTARRKRVEARAAALIAEEISHDLTGARSRKGESTQEDFFTEEDARWERRTEEFS